MNISPEYFSRIFLNKHNYPLSGQEHLRRIFSIMSISIHVCRTWYFVDSTINNNNKKDDFICSDEAADSDHTVGYIVSGDSSDNYDSSDDEPLSKYVVKRSMSPEFDNDNITTQSNSKHSKKPSDDRRRGRPKGRAKPKNESYLSGFKIVQRHVRRDRVDEECALKGIVYKKWEPLHPDQDSHPSVRDINDETIIPDEQEIPQWCILCPRNRHLRTRDFAVKHYLRVHHAKLYVVRDYKMLSCKCSEIRSHGSDHSARNLHFHCFLCYHPFKSADLLATHLITRHTEIDLCEVRHLMRASNPHRHYSYEFS